MKVLARTDRTPPRDDTARAHPDWIAVDVDGRPRRHWPTPSSGHLRARPLHFEFMTAVPSRDRLALRQRRHLHQPLGQQNRLLLRALPPGFRAATASSCRARPTPSNPARRAVLAWRKARLTELWDVWDADIPAPVGRVFVPNGRPTCAPQA